MTEIRYEPDGETLKRFLVSQARVRLIQGPRGSGKSRLSVVSLLKEAMDQTPSPDGKRRSKSYVIRRCYSSDTEILTETGWKMFPDLQHGERVAMLDGGELVYAKPTFYYSAPYKGEMIGFENEGVDFLVTPDHQMYVSKLYGRGKVWGDFGLKHAKDIFGNGDCRVKRDAIWLGGKTEASVGFFEWLGFWFAEGSACIYRGRHACTITQSKNLAYVRRLFSGAGIPYHENKRTDGGTNFRVKVTDETKPLVRLLASTGKSTTKAVPDWIRNAPPEHLRAFISGFVAGDGCTHNGTTIAYTSSRQLADDLQILALKAGMVANVRCRENRIGIPCVIKGIKTASTAAQYVVTFVTKSKYTPRLKIGGYAGKYTGWRREQYNGMVYCLEVPTHVIYVRRNGKAFWCSQTFDELKRTTLATWQLTLPEAIFGPVKWSRPFEHNIRVSGLEWDVFFLSLDDPKDLEKLRSAEISSAWVNEFSEVDRAVLSDLEPCLGRYPNKEIAPPNGCKRPFLIADTNPGPELHWFSIMSGQSPVPPNSTPEQRRAYEKPNSWEIFLQPPGMFEQFLPDGKVFGYVQNPNAENLRWLPAGYYENMIHGKSRSWIRRNVCNKPSSEEPGSPVWPEFQEHTHVSPKPLTPLPGHPILFGVDFGRTPACVMGQHVFNRWFILKELTAEDCGAKDFARRLRSFLSINFPGHATLGWGDPAGAHLSEADDISPLLMFRAEGFRTNFHPAPTNDPVVRIDSVREVLLRSSDGSPTFLMSPDCVALKAAMNDGYKYPDRAGDEAVTPIKNEHSHVADALQYLMIGAGEGRALLNQRPAKAHVAPPPPSVFKRAARILSRPKIRGWNP